MNSAIYFYEHVRHLRRYFKNHFSDNRKEIYKIIRVFNFCIDLEEEFVIYQRNLQKIDPRISIAKTEFKEIFDDISNLTDVS